MDTDSAKVRLGAVGIVAMSLFLALFARLWFLQGIERQEFEAASVSNRLRVIQTEGPRGRILDRNGRVIVDNRTTIVVALDREPPREQAWTRRERRGGSPRRSAPSSPGKFGTDGVGAHLARSPRPRTTSSSATPTSATRFRNPSWPRTSVRRSSSTSWSGPRTSPA
ncbi:MAG: hypothetical protein R2716_00860 [Microthrixaceae bacterium]